VVRLRPDGEKAVPQRGGRGETRKKSPKGAMQHARMIGVGIKGMPFGGVLQRSIQEMFQRVKLW